MASRTEDRIAELEEENTILIEACNKLCENCDNNISDEEFDCDNKTCSIFKAYGKLEKK